MTGAARSGCQWGWRQGPLTAVLQNAAAVLCLLVPSSYAFILKQDPTPGSVLGNLTHGAAICRSALLFRVCLFPRPRAGVVSTYVGGLVIWCCIMQQGGCAGAQVRGVRLRGSEGAQVDAHAVGWGFLSWFWEISDFSP